MTITLDARYHQPFEVGAMLDAIVCFPKYPAERQHRIAKAISADLIMRWIDMEPHRRAELQPVMRDFRREAGRTSYGSLEKRRRQALIAGQSFLPLIKERACGALPLLSGKYQTLSQHQIAKFLWPPEEEGLEENYESRLKDRKVYDIRPWHPVAHLAAAYQAMARLKSGEADSYRFNYQDLDFHALAVSLARKFAEFFRAAPELANISGNLVDIEIVLPD